METNQRLYVSLICYHSIEEEATHVIPEKETGGNTWTHTTMMMKQHKQNTFDLSSGIYISVQIN